ncbi:hypothetical protein RF11_15052 [Thelohanellus kitauei]|uniref:Uncharacterized protein n=1 Tax=Thelohanellus kitauei TaxID=669202 RepID=A0A0C2J404_THEKT|nr:hypothetical protein RF11_15052 [Thelohanellus kitauei]
MKVYDSAELVSCNITVTLVKKLDESACILILIQAYFALACQMVHKNCVRSFMIHINKNGYDIDQITLKRLDTQKGLIANVPECGHDPNPYFKIRLLKVCGITSAVTITNNGRHEVTSEPNNETSTPDNTK